MSKTILRKQVFSIIDTYSLTETFTTADIAKRVTYKNATNSGIAKTIQEYPGIINLERRDTTHIWRRTE